jgi:hypothetical protein
MEKIRTWMDRMNKIRMEKELADAEASFPTEAEVRELLERVPSR